jgi:hypothetical protein
LTAWITRAQLDLIQAIGLAGTVTYSWLLGAGRIRFGATLFGFISGLIAALIVTGVLWAARGGFMYDAHTNQLIAKSWIGMLDTATGAGLLLWGLVGLVGGFVIDFLDHNSAGIKIAIVCLMVVLLVDVLLASPNLVPNLAMLLGWGLALTLHPAFATGLAKAGPGLRRPA